MDKLYINKSLYLFMTMSLLSLTACTSSIRQENISLEREIISKNWSQNEKEVSKQSQYSTSTFWLGFNSPQLMNLLEKLEQSNPELDISLKRIELATVPLRSVKSNYYPELTVGAKSSRIGQSKREFEHSKIEGYESTDKRVNNNYMLPFSISYQPDIWGKISDREASIKHELLATESDKNAVKIAQETLLAENYFYWLLSHKEIQLLEEVKEILHEYKDMLQLQISAGLIATDELIQVKENISTVDKRLQSKQADSITLRHSIAILLGQSPQAFQLSVAEIDIGNDITPHIRPNIPSQVLLHRPDIVSLEYRFIAAGARISEARKACLPSLSLTSEYGFNSRSLSKLVRADAVAWGVTAELVGVIFDGGRRNAEVELTKIEQEILVKEYKKTVLNALFEVEEALVTRQNIATQISLQNRNIRLIEKELLLSQARLKKGLTDKTEKLLLERRVLEAIIEQQTLNTALKVNVVTLNQAVAGQVIH